MSEQRRAHEAPAVRGELRIAGDFPPASRERWQTLAEASLKGRPLASLTTTTHEGIDRQPLYDQGDLPPSSRAWSALPAQRSQRPHIIQLLACPDPERAARQLQDGLRQGADGAWLRLDQRCRLGLPVDDPGAGPGSDGLLLNQAADLEPLLAELAGHADGPIAISLEPGGNAVAAAAGLLAALERLGIDRQRLRGCLGCDPLGALAMDAELPGDLDTCLRHMADLTRWTMANAPQLRALALSSLPYHLAGANAAQELACTVATGVEYLRALEDAGIPAEQACTQVQAVLAIGRDLFMEIAKLRALPRLWWRVRDACGIAGQTPELPCHAFSSPRTLTVRDPWVNLLRGTVQSFAAISGGAESITVMPFDSAAGASDALAVRMALNTPTILCEESRLHRVSDPAAGSWYVEQLSEELARRAWTMVQQIEGRGGMRSALLGGYLNAQLGEALEQRRRAVGRRSDPITGVSSYANLQEQPLERRPVDLAALSARLASGTPDATGELDDRLAALSAAARDPAGGREGSVTTAAIGAAAAGATLSQMAGALAAEPGRTAIAPLAMAREAEQLEELRDASDRHREVTGGRPQVFLASMGTLGEHRARTSFSESFVQAGGLEPLGGHSFDTVAAALQAFRDSGAACAVICSSDRRYPELVPELAAGLKNAGARCVVLAGRPGDNETPWRRAGVDRFIFVGCDLLEHLMALHAATGVAS